MIDRARFAFALILLISVASCAVEPVAPAAVVYPGKSWERIEEPAALGWSPQRLDELRERLSRTRALGMFVVYGGRELFEYGDVRKPNASASMRKSMLSELYGIYAASGKIRLDATLAELGIDDLGGLSAQEKEATVRDLLTARSGVYHPAANTGDDLDQAPPRNSQKHGTYFLYNNWDFNALGTIFEKQTGQDLYDAFEHDLARPLGMEDFRRSEQKKSGNLRLSMHPAYPFQLSARDYARFGYLMLRGGDWSGRQLVPRDWVKQTTGEVTPVAQMHPAKHLKGPLGYGYLWWVWDAPWAKGAYQGAFTARGLGGQFITVLPALDIVVAFDTPRGGGTVGLPEYLGLLDALVAAHCLETPCR
jgi:CubicO group peptidase (beta-lactamase class C family)